MPRTATRGVPKGWCSRNVTKSEGGIPASKADKRSFRTVKRSDTLMITYGCPKGSWKPSGSLTKTVCRGRGKKRKCKKDKLPGKCTTGMRTVRIMKPKKKAMKSRNRAKYKCVPK